MRKVMIVLLAVAFSLMSFAQNSNNSTKKKIPANSKVFLAPMGGFEDELKAAIQRKKVPVVLVTDKEQADYEITGTSETEKAGAAKKVILLDWHSNEQASITVTDHRAARWCLPTRSTRRAQPTANAAPPKLAPST